MYTNRKWEKKTKNITKTSPEERTKEIFKCNFFEGFSLI